MLNNYFYENEKGNMNYELAINISKIKLSSFYTKRLLYPRNVFS